MKIVFPKNIGQHYWDIHYQFVLNLFQGCDIEFQDLGEDNTRSLIRLIIDGKGCFINYSDFGNDAVKDLKDPVFKMHYKEGDKAFPFTPVSFYDWNWYNNIGIKLQYKAEGFISNRQKPYLSALQSRGHVQGLLQNENARHNIINQESYFKEVENILVAVCVPGARNNMLDRGQLQYAALGVCTISPCLPEILPFNKKLVPGIHYIQCKDDYSDLLDIIRQCKEGERNCFEIGLKAKELFLTTCHPLAIKTWIKECLEI